MTWRDGTRLARWAALVACSTVFLACANGTRVTTVPGPPPRPLVERLSADTVRLRWPASLGTEQTTVRAGLDPDSIEQVVAEVDGTAVRLRASHSYPYVSDRFRLYYELLPADGGPGVVTAERRLPLRGVDNFRDLGGYAAADGRSVRWGRLYRANDLSELDADDLGYLSSIGVKLVCDFRSDTERQLKPSRSLDPADPERLELSIDQEGVDPTTVQDEIRTGGITALAMQETMLRSYRAFVTEYSDQWAAMFRRLSLPESLPTVVHCTAGKDRTGFASALVLLALGVSEETVFEDYLLTNRYRSDFRAFVLRWTPLYSLFRTDPDDLLPLLEARREYLEASLDQIRTSYGSVDGYLEEGLGVTASMRESLRRNLLR